MQLHILYCIYFHRNYTKDVVAFVLSQFYSMTVSPSLPQSTNHCSQAEIAKI